MPVRDLDWFMAPRLGIEVIANRGASGIDGFVSTALGAAATRSPTVALAGDISLLHDQTGFLIQPRPDLVIVAINNDGGGIFSFLPQASFPADFERLFGTPHGVDLGALARVHGLKHQRLDEGGQLPGLIRDGLSAGGCHLVEIVTDRQENVARHRQLTARVVEALAAQ
jgi:2-succinyl-5-enolpyruvyl-6-hydroxy-3-cyclohexene-1-carboxylate synthase